MPVIDKTRLRAAREQRGLTREIVALSIGKTYRTIAAYESGQAVPPGNVLVALANLYRVAVEDLCSERTPPLSESQRERLAALLDVAGGQR